jgi:recombination protein RecT
VENYVTVIKNQAEKFREVNTNLDFNKEEVFAVQQFANNAALVKCSITSIQLAVLNVGLTGLSLNPSLAYAYLIPRKGKCVLDISYRGMIQIAYNAGAVKNIRVEVVRKNDVFEYHAGSKNTLLHSPNVFASVEERGEIIGVYSVAVYVNGEISICCMSKEEVEFIKSKSQAVIAGKDTIWKEWEGEMYKKTVLKRHFKMLPKSGKLLEAVAILNEHEGIDFKKQEKDEKSDITMPEPIKQADITPDDGSDAQMGDGMSEQPVDGEGAHGANADENEFSQQMGRFKKALTEPVYRKHLIEDIGVETSRLVTNPSSQADTIAHFQELCDELKVKVEA